MDPSNVMPHRRRRPFKPYMKQMRNYGYTRMVANKRWPEIAAWSHTAVGLFPWLVIAATLAMLAGASTVAQRLICGSPSRASGACPASPSMARWALLHSTWPSPGWSGHGTSPHRSIGTVALAPLFVFLAHWAYGQGVNKRGGKSVEPAGPLALAGKSTTATDHLTQSCWSAGTGSRQCPRTTAPC